MPYHLMLAPLYRRLQSGREAGGRRRRRVSAVAILTAATLGVGATAVPRDVGHAAFTTTCSTTLFAAHPMGYLDLLQEFPGLIVATSQSPAETDICIEIAVVGNNESETGGTVRVTGAASVQPVVDTQATACQSATGYSRLAGGAVLTTSFFIDDATPTGSVELCIAAGSVGVRVLMAASPGGLPQASFSPDVLTPAVTYVPWPTSGPSGTCAAQSFSSYGYYTASPEGQLWWAVLPVDSGPAPAYLDVCVRYQGSMTVGGVLTVSLPVSLNFNAGSAPCSTNVVSLTNPVAVQVSTSAIGAWPFDLCVAGTLLLSTTNPTSPPSSPTWTKDSDSSF